MTIHLQSTIYTTFLQTSPPSSTCYLSSKIDKTTPTIDRTTMFGRCLFGYSIDDAVYLYKDSSTMLSSATYTAGFLAGTTYKIKLTVTSAGVMSIYIDTSSDYGTTLIISATDTLYSTGYFGIHAATNIAWMDNLTISGTRYYNTPMLRGAQQGAYYNGTASVPCTRFVDDFDWATIAEYTVGASASSIDNTNGWLTLADATAIYPTGITMGVGIYSFLLLRSGASGVANITIAGNAITITYAGAITIGGTAYTGTALTSPVWVTFVATGTQIAVYSNGVLIGTKTGLTLTASTIQLSRTTANVYVLDMQINAIESTAGNKPVVIGGVPHGARYDVQEYAVRSFTNAVRYGEYRLASAIKTTNPSSEDVELYLKNATDSSYITDDSSDTVAVALSDTNWANVTKNAFLNADDVSDTITIQARRKTAATDNTPACLVDFVELLPIVEVG